MTAQADITVKKADGTTDVVYTAIVPSSGDRGPARWRSNSVGTTAAEKPTFTAVSRSNGPGTARRMEFTYVYPIPGTDPSTGRPVVYDKIIFNNGGWVIPNGALDTQVLEAVYQFGNIMANAHVKAFTSSGYAPT